MYLPLSFKNLLKRYLSKNNIPKIEGYTAWTVKFVHGERPLIVILRGGAVSPNSGAVPPPLYITTRGNGPGAVPPGPFPMDKLDGPSGISYSSKEA